MQNELELIIDANGSKYWYLNGVRHRTDGPAVEYATGDKEWWQNGVRHREDGPAIDYVVGHREWWQNGVRHREDGPAVEYSDGDKSWYLNNTGYSFEEWLELTTVSEQEKVKLRLQYAERTGTNNR